ncbi:hypothetical protein ACN2CC_24030 [Mesorhizobium muleiense]|uniref:hypothetical protein n=1 Tax=Mesorhizobium muleiense TaxID=1004279 RepID=UPI003AFB32AB
MVGAALSDIMAIIMTHHMAIISAQFAVPQARGSVAIALMFMPDITMPDMSMPGISEVISDVMFGVCRCGNNVSLDISHAFMPIPAPAAM